MVLLAFFYALYYLAIILALFLSGSRTRPTYHGNRPLDGISGTLINEVFRQIKAGKTTINTCTEFCRAANSHVPSMKPLFQRTNDIYCRTKTILITSHPSMMIGKKT